MAPVTPVPIWAAIVQNIYPAKTRGLPGTRTFQYVKLEQEIQTFKYRLKFRFLCQVKSDWCEMLNTPGIAKFIPYVPFLITRQVRFSGWHEIHWAGLMVWNTMRFYPSQHSPGWDWHLNRGYGPGAKWTLSLKGLICTAVQWVPRPLAFPTKQRQVFREKDCYFF